MRKFGAYLFDLDGTLIDSKPGIVESIKYSLSHFGIEENDEKVLNSFIGPPLIVSFTNHYGFDKAKAEDALVKYRERYVSHGIYNCALYPEVINTLDALKKRGARIALATSKLQKYADEILENLKITRYFDHAQGADDVSVFEKPQVVAACIAALEAQFGRLDKSDIAIVGDRKFDITGAKANGIMSVGVLYGYSEPDELRVAGADFIVENLSGILE